MKARLRKLLAEKPLLVSAGAYDALSAKAMESAGFDVVFLSGFGLSASLLGKPDSGLLTLTEVIDHARAIARAVNIPVLADAEDGYGGPVNIQRTVDEFERAGVAGIFIEDQVHPVMCGTIRKYKRIIPAEEMVPKIRAAVAARKDPDFVIAARTDADIVSVEEQIRRCNLYSAAGADLVMPIPTSKEEFAAMAQGIKAPIWANLWAQADFTPKDLEEMGIRGIVQYPVEPTFVVTTALLTLAREIREKGTVRETFARFNAIGYKHFFEFIGLQEIVDVDQRYAMQATSPG